MGIYISSSGIKNDTQYMNIEYLQRALAKAIKNGDTANIAVLQEEINKRNG